MASHDDEVSRHRLEVADILTLKCPRCSQAFLDFDNCFALTCSRPTCNAAFCGWCLEDCGADAHQHVTDSCCTARTWSPANPLWSTATNFKAAQRERQGPEIQKYIDQVEPALRADVLEAVGSDLTELGFSVEGERLVDTSGVHPPRASTPLATPGQCRLATPAAACNSMPMVAHANVAQYGAMPRATPGAQVYQARFPVGTPFPAPQRMPQNSVTYATRPHVQMVAAHHVNQPHFVVAQPRLVHVQA